MKKAPKLSKQQIAYLAKTPSFWESFRFTHGSYANAAKKMKLDPKILSRLGKFRTAFQKAPEITDETLDKLAKGLKRIDKRDYITARQFVYVPASREFGRGASAHMTPSQLAYAKRYTKRGEKEQAYFRKSVRDYYEGKTKRVLMPALDVDTGKTYGAGKSPTIRQLAQRARKREKRHAFRRAGRRGNR